MVIQKEGGPYSLYCTNCKVWIANTANYEMKKEGFFAHSHVCGVKSKWSTEMSDEEWQRKKKYKDFLEEAFKIADKK